MTGSWGCLLTWISSEVRRTRSSVHLAVSERVLEMNCTRAACTGSTSSVMLTPAMAGTKPSFKDTINRICRSAEGEAVCEGGGGAGRGGVTTPTASADRQKEVMS